MKLFVLFMTIAVLLTSCNSNGNKTGDFYTKCAISDIKEIKKSDYKNRKVYIIETDCGNSIIRSSNNINKGDTVIIRQN
jgi:hypothetical protein